MNMLGSRKGSALLMALLGVVILSGLAILMVKRATFGMKDTANFRRIQSSFTAAEAGLEHGRNLLNNGAANTWDDELASVHQIGVDGLWDTADDVLTNFINSTSLNSMQSYVVTIEDNVDLDTSPIVDADYRIWVISTGTSGSKTVTLRVLLENDSQDAHISQEHYGERSLGQAKGESRNVANNNRGTL